MLLRGETLIEGKAATGHVARPPGGLNKQPGANTHTRNGHTLPSLRGVSAEIWDVGHDGVCIRHRRERGHRRAMSLDSSRRYNSSRYIRRNTTDDTTAQEVFLTFGSCESMYCLLWILLLIDVCPDGRLNRGSNALHIAQGDVFFRGRSREFG